MPCRKNIHSIRAQELADWLKKQSIKGINKAIELEPDNFEEKIKDKKGIIFFKDYWQRSTDKGDIRTGDHIDLWDTGSLASNGSLYSWIRLNFSDFSENWLSMSDLKKI